MPKDQLEKEINQKRKKHLNSEHLDELMKLMTGALKSVLSPAIAKSEELVQQMNVVHANRSLLCIELTRSTKEENLEEAGDKLNKMAEATILLKRGSANNCQGGSGTNIANITRSGNPNSFDSTSLNFFLIIFYFLFCFVLFYFNFLNLKRGDM